MRSRYFHFVMTLAVVFSLSAGAMAQVKAFDMSRVDTSADACDDFFQYANGACLKSTQIPSSQSSWGSFNILSEANRDILHDILEKAAANKAATGDEKLIGDFYASCMDEASIEKAGTSAMDPTLNTIG